MFVATVSHPIHLSSVPSEAWRLSMRREAVAVLGLEAGKLGRSDVVAKISCNTTSYDRTTRSLLQKGSIPFEQSIEHSWFENRLGLVVIKDWRRCCRE